MALTMAMKATAAAAVGAVALGAFLMTRPRSLEAYPEELAGVGIVLHAVPEGLVIEKLVEGGPAASAGLHAGDRVLAVNGQSTTGQPLAVVVESLRGAAGSTVVMKTTGEQGSAEVTLTRKPLAKHGAEYQAGAPSTP